MVALLMVAIVLVGAGLVAVRVGGPLLRDLRAAEYRDHVTLPVIPDHEWHAALPADVAMTVGTGVTLPDDVPALLRTTLQYSGRARDNVVGPQSTTIHDTTVIAFDHVYRTSSRGAHEQVEHDACVKFAVGVHCPLTIVTARSNHKEQGPDLGDGLTRVELPSDDFNRTYDVATQDTRFAFHLFDAPMIEWFLADLRLHTIVFSDTDVLVSFSAPGGRSSSLSVNGVPVSLVDPEPTDPDLALPFVAGFLERIPPVLTFEFGAPASS